ncbi:heme/steroid binding protein-like protein [Geopyxis carbonaria]|nr:heme/steroid binding protein-like protein [Geopyxis carbonaria]
MIVGVSLLCAVFSYLAYRRLCCAAPDAAAASAGWPGWSALMGGFLGRKSTPPTPPTTSLSRRTTASTSPTIELTTPSSSSTTTSTKSPSPSPSPALSNGLPVTPQPPTVAPPSPNTTPRATPSRPASRVPAISLDDDPSDDLPPAFPALHSAQRARGGISSLNTAPAPRPSPSSSLAMPPPPIPHRNPQRNSLAAARTPVSRLAVVGQGAAGVAAGSGLSAPNGRGSSSSRSRKVTLEPGHSPLDWARLQKSGVDLRGLPHQNLIKVPPSLLAAHKKPPADVWMALAGKVYNITAYMSFHPGGERELLRGAGRDGTALFNATHPWVNVEGMLGECLVGILVSEEEAAPAAAEGGGVWEQVD